MAYRFAYFWLDHDAPVTPGRIVQAAITMLIVTLVSNWTCQYFFRWFPFMGKHNPIFEFDPDGKTLDVLLGQWIWPFLKPEEKYLLEEVEERRMYWSNEKRGTSSMVTVTVDKEVTKTDIDSIEEELKKTVPGYKPVNRTIKIK